MCKFLFLSIHCCPLYPSLPFYSFHLPLFLYRLSLFSFFHHRFLSTSFLSSLLITPLLAFLNISLHGNYGSIFRADGTSAVTFLEPRLEWATVRLWLCWRPCWLWSSGTLLNFTDQCAQSQLLSKYLHKHTHICKWTQTSGQLNMAEHTHT